VAAAPRGNTTGLSAPVCDGSATRSPPAALSELSDRQLFNMALHIAALPMELPRPAQQFLCMHYFLLSLTRVLEAGSIDSLDDDYEEWDHWCDVVARAARGDADVVAWTALVERLSEAELALYAAEFVVKHNTKLFDACSLSSLNKNHTRARLE
jgi:hypothetical protein